MILTICPTPHLATILMVVVPRQALQSTAGVPAELIAFGSAWGADPTLGTPPLRISC